MKRLAGTFALILAAGACTSDASTTTTINEPAPTTLAQATTTTKPQIILGGLIEADPATLIPLEGAEPIVVGPAHQGVVSPDGSKVAVRTDLSDGRILVSTFEVGSYELLSSVDVDHSPQLLTITDDGNAYWFSDAIEPAIYLLTPDTDASYALAHALPNGFVPFDDKITLLGDGALGLFGHYPDAEGEDTVSVLLIEVTGTTATHDLVDVAVTSEDRLVTPTAVWDTGNDRVLVVAATEDIVYEVSLAGAITERPWAGQGAAVHRDAALSPDGTRLFIASASVEISEGVATESPQDLVVLDPVSWVSGELIDVAVDRLWPSPAGETLLAQGAEVTDSSVRPSPIYLIDMTTAQVGLGFQTNDATRTEVQFSAGETLAYLVSVDAAGDRVDILDLDSQDLTGAMAFERLSLIGRAGLVAFHQ